jgi:hypothetical protein
MLSTFHATGVANRASLFLPTFRSMFPPTGAEPNHPSRVINENDMT